MSPQSLQSIAAIFAAYAALTGALYAFVTRPILRVLKVELGAVRAEIELSAAEFKLEMAEMEKRLNEHIDTKLIHR